MIDTENPKWNISDRHSDGSTGLHRACWGKEPRHTETVKKFIELGVSPLEADKNGKTCIDMTSNSATWSFIKKATEAYQNSEL